MTRYFLLFLMLFTSISISWSQSLPNITLTTNLSSPVYAKVNESLQIDFRLSQPVMNGLNFIKLVIPARINGIADLNKNDVLTNGTIVQNPANEINAKVEGENLQINISPESAIFSTGLLFSLKMTPTTIGQTTVNITGVYEVGNISGKVNPIVFVINVKDGTAPCPVPLINQSSIQVTENSISLGWDRVTGAIGYELQYRQEGTISFGQPIAVTGTSYRIENLKSGTSYEFQVRSVCSTNQRSEFSSPPSIATTKTQQQSMVNFCYEVTPTSLMVGDEVEISVSISGNTGFDFLNVEFPVLSNYFEFSNGSNRAGDVFSGVSKSPEIKFLPSDNLVEFSYEGDAQSIVTRNGKVGSFKLRAKIPGNINLNTLRAVIKLGNNASIPTAICPDTKTITITSGTPSCATPTNVTPTVTGTTTGTVSWNAAINATGYEVTLVPSVSGFNGNTTATTLALTNLAPNTTYTVTVKAICGTTGMSQASSPVNFTTQSQQSCPTPTNVTANVTGTTTGTVSWNAVSNATGYEVILLPSVSGFNGNTTATTLALRNLAPNTTYTVTVKAICGTTGMSQASSPVNFTTQSQQSCPTPTNVTANVTGTTTGTVSWNAVSNATSYEVTLLPIVSGFNGNTTTTTLALTNLAPNTTYTVTVKAICGTTGMSQVSSPVNFTTQSQQPCNPPSGVSSGQITATSVIISWIAPSDGASVTNYTVIVNPGNRIIPFITGKNTAISNLTPDTEYTVEVKSNCSTGSSSGVEKAIFKTLKDESPCNSPSAIQATNIKSSSLLLNWTNPLGSSVLGYIITITPGNLIFMSSDTSKIIEGLLPKTNYRACVKTKCSNGLSRDEKCVLFTTLDNSINDCDSPISPVIVEITGTSAIFNWKSPNKKADNRYRVELNPGGFSTVTSDTSIRVVSLTPNISYTFCVRTICSNNDISENICLNFSTNREDCGPVTMPRVSTVSSKSALIEWNVDYQPINFEVTLNPGNYIRIVNDTGITLENLIPNTDYNICIASRCTGGLVSITRCSTFKTKMAPNNRESFNNSDFSIYPNPVREDLEIKFKGSEIGQVLSVSVFDISGKVILYQNFDFPHHSTSSVKVNMSQLPAGVYSVRVMNGDASSWSKVIKLD